MRNRIGVGMTYLCSPLMREASFTYLCSPLIREASLGCFRTPSRCDTLPGLQNPNIELSSSSNVRPRILILRLK